MPISLNAIAALHNASQLRIAIYNYAYYVRRMTDDFAFLLVDVTRQMRRRFDERARRSGATGTQWRTLKILERSEGINQGHLAEMLEVEPITACRMIDRLEESGLVERRRDPGDRRAWQIFLTEKSRPVLAELHVTAAGMIEDLLHGLTTGQRETLIELLTAMRSNLNIGNESDEAANG